MAKVYLSVVMPALNEELDIGKTLRYVRSIEDVEIIVVDGGSKDNTVKIAKKYADKVIVSHGGTIGKARNIGAGYAKGEVILFLDADTVPHVEFFDKLKTIFSRDKKVVGLGCVIMPRRLSFFETLFFYLLNFLVHLSVQLRRPCIAGSCVAYRRSSFVKATGFDEERAASEDQDFSIKISKFGSVIFLPRIVTYTSSRRLRVLGFFGLLVNWLGTTFNFLLGIKTKKYALTHSKA
ncbi:MAG: glycosyltransferase [Candidatus Micrarchaeota archaeon]